MVILESTMYDIIVVSSWGTEIYHIPVDDVLYYSGTVVVDWRIVT